MKKNISEEIKKWWNGNAEKPLISICIVKDRNIHSCNNYWVSENSLPDFEKIVDAQIENSKKLDYLGVSYPGLPHLWGSRGTPMTMCAYLGSNVVFGEDTVWYKKFISDWRNVDIRFDEHNWWVQASRKLMQTQIEKASTDLVIALPDLGDALTCFSMMRGVEELLLDIIEIPEIIIEKIEQFVSAWIQAHKFFHSIYRSKYDGDATWLIWAPGKTYACQCDFSTMISPRMFEKFVVYELDKIKDYLDYIAWHLDGPDEIKHLDILLSLPYVRTIQVTPGAGRPPCASELWMPNIKKILDKGKNVIVYASNQDEFGTLINNFPSGRVFIGCRAVNLENENDRKFLNLVEKYL